MVDNIATNILLSSLLFEHHRPAAAASPLTMKSMVYPTEHLLLLPSNLTSLFMVNNNLAHFRLLLQFKINQL